MDRNWNPGSYRDESVSSFFQRVLRSRWQLAWPLECMATRIFHCFRGHLITGLLTIYRQTRLTSHTSLTMFSIFRSSTRWAKWLILQLPRHQNLKLYHQTMMTISRTTMITIITTTHHPHHPWTCHLTTHHPHQPRTCHQQLPTQPSDVFINIISQNTKRSQCCSVAIVETFIGTSRVSLTSNWAGFTESRLKRNDFLLLSEWVITVEIASFKHFASPHRSSAWNKRRWFKS